MKLHAQTKTYFHPTPSAQCTAVVIVTVHSRCFCHSACYEGLSAAVINYQHSFGGHELTCTVTLKPKGIVSRDFLDLEMILMDRTLVHGIPLVIYFLSFHTEFEVQ